MNMTELVSLVQGLQEQVKTLSEQNRTFRDIEDIKKLQCSYGYYLENYMTDEIAALFSQREDTIIRVHAGEFKGKKGVLTFFKPKGKSQGVRNPGFIHQVMQLSPVIDVAPDGLTARGRWYGFGAVAIPVKDQDRVFQGWMNGVYENDYIKENGVWKIWKLRWWMYFNAPYGIGWVAPEKQADKSFQDKPHVTNYDEPPFETLYPTRYICPFHYANPVTGQPVEVEQERSYFS
jgi:hypothetical protein